MRRTEAITWGLSVAAPYLRLSRTKTLSVLVGAALRVHRVSLAAIGRAMTDSQQAKHRIKRAWRSLTNPHLVIREAMQGVIAGLAKRHRRKPLVVALDWTDIRGFSTLLAEGPAEGTQRGVFSDDRPGSAGGGALRLYAQRMSIEALFRDLKNKRNGFALLLTQVTRAERVDRLLLILALAYVLLVGVGLYARRRLRPGPWCSNNRAGTCGVFVIGRIRLNYTRLSATAVFALVLAATAEAAPNWG